METGLSLVENIYFNGTTEAEVNRQTFEQDLSIHSHESF